MALDLAMQDALDGVSALLFVAVLVDLPDAPLCLLDGSGEVTFGDHTFVGGDPDLGVLAGIEKMSQGLGNEAPSLRLTINPPTNAASATLSSPGNQGAAVKVWFGVLGQADGQVIGDPYLLFDGDVDQPILSVGEGSRSLTLECVSAIERAREDDEGVRLNDAFHQSIWPGELGLEFVTEVGHDDPWGRDEPKPGASRAGGGPGVSPQQAVQQAVDRIFG